MRIVNDPGSARTMCVMCLCFYLFVYFGRVFRRMAHNSSARLHTQTHPIHTHVSTDHPQYIYDLMCVHIRLEMGRCNFILVSAALARYLFSCFGLFSLGVKTEWMRVHRIMSISWAIITYTTRASSQAAAAVAVAVSVHRLPQAIVDYPRGSY